MFRTPQLSPRFALRTRRTLPVLLLGACLCFAFCIVAQSQDGASPPDAPAIRRARSQRQRQATRRARTIEREPRARLLAQTLDLTAEQRRQLVEIRRRNRIERRALVARLRHAERELDNQIYADDIDKDEIDLRVRRVSDLQSELARLRANVELELRRVLTADQLRRLRTLREQARTRS